MAILKGDVVSASLLAERSLPGAAIVTIEAVRPLDLRFGSPTASRDRSRPDWGPRERPRRDGFLRAAWTGAMPGPGIPDLRMPDDPVGLFRRPHSAHLCATEIQERRVPVTTRAVTQRGGKEITQRIPERPFRDLRSTHC